MLLKQESIKLYCGDCLDIMSNISDNSIDMILCDLPYGTTWNKWDSRLDFDKLWEHYKRIIKPCGAIVLTAIQPFTSLLVTSNLEMYRCSWVWIKDNATNFINAKNQPMRKTEDILVFSKAGMCPQAKTKCVYNPQGLKLYDKITIRGSSGSNYMKVGKANYQKYTNYPDNILKFPHDKTKYHPTQKPIALLEYLIRTYSNEGDTVFDNCMGSGSTGVACMNTNRKFIGIEKDSKYFNIAKGRLNMTNEKYYYESCIHALMQKGYDYEKAKDVVEFAPLTAKIRSGDGQEYFNNMDVDDWIEVILGKGNHNQH